MFVLLYLSMKAWCSRNIGSLAEPCTDDMEPFMNMCKELCMVLWPDRAIPVSGLAKPAEDTRYRSDKSIHSGSQCSRMNLNLVCSLLYTKCASAHSQDQAD